MIDENIGAQSLVGRKARVIRTIHVNNGKIIRKGTVVRIYKTWRGKFGIERLRVRGTCSDVSRHDLELIIPERDEESRGKK